MISRLNEEYRDSTEAEYNYLALRCMQKIWIRGAASVDFYLHVLTPKAVPVARYELMCGAIDEFIDADYARAVLGMISDAETSDQEIEAAGFAYTCWLNHDGVRFDFEFGEKGLETGGKVSLLQFKVAVETYLEFLLDPDRKPVQIEFPLA